MRGTDFPFLRAIRFHSGHERPPGVARADNRPEKSGRQDAITHWRNIRYDNIDRKNGWGAVLAPAGKKTTAPISTKSPGGVTSVFGDVGA